MQLKKNYTLKTATAFVVASMIGTGIFTSLGYQVMHTDSAFSIMFLWILGGLAAITGALTYCALALLMPRSGGEYHFLSNIYGEAIGYATGVITIVVGFAAPIAIAAILFGEYLAHVIAIPAHYLAYSCLGLVTIMHLFDVKKGGQAHVLATALKVVLILALLIAGLFFANLESVSFTPTAYDLSLITSSSFGISLVWVTYSYTGWSAAVYIIDELEQPERNIPRALLIGVGIVTVLYLALNAVFLLTTPMEMIAGKKDFAYYVGRQIFGDNGAALMALLISIGLVSTVSAMMVTSSRVVFRMAEDDPLLGIFKNTDKKGTPFAAILLIAFCSFLFCFLAFQSLEGFKTVLEYAGFILSFFGAFAAIGLFIVKARKPEIKMPFGSWFFPLVPLVYLLIKLMVIAYMIWDDQSRIFYCLLTFGIALACYVLSRLLRAVQKKSLVSDN